VGATAKSATRRRVEVVVQFSLLPWPQGGSDQMPLAKLPAPLITKWKSETIMPGRLMVPGSAAAEIVSPEIVSVVVPLACATVSANASDAASRFGAVKLSVSV
jgi:hypothetical protein